MTRFKAFLIDKDSDKINYTLGMNSVEDLPKGELLIQSKYSAVNELDISVFGGHSGMLKQFPKTPGIDVSGVVVQSSSKNFIEGDEVVVTGFGLGVSFEGSYAEYLRVPETIATRVPTGTNMLESMILGSDGLTATMATLRLTSEGVNIGKDNRKVLVIGGTSTVGCIAVMLLKRMKFTVVAVCDNKDKKEFLTTLGADEVMSASEYFEASKSRKDKFSGIIDSIGGDYLQATFNLIKSGGTIVTTSYVNKRIIEIDSSHLVANLIDLFGIHSVFCDMDTKMYVWDQLASYGDSKMLLWLLNEISLNELPAYIDFAKRNDINGRLVINHSL